VRKSTSREQQAQINADYLVALKFERKEASRLRAQLAEAKREHGYDESHSRKVVKVPVAERAKSVKKETQSADVPSYRSMNIRGVVIGTDRGSSKLLKRSRLRRAMHGD
jgi:hypothetical protein